MKIIKHGNDIPIGKYNHYGKYSCEPSKVRGFNSYRANGLKFLNLDAVLSDRTHSRPTTENFEEGQRTLITG